MNSITLSPVYPAAASLLGSERGLSMRFPRFMKRRDDKTWEQASTSEQFADMYRRQIQEAPKRAVQPVKGGEGEGEDEGGEGVQGLQGGADEGGEASMQDEEGAEEGEEEDEGSAEGDDGDEDKEDG